MKVARITKSVLQQAFGTRKCIHALLQLLGIDHCSRIFHFIFWLCASVISLGHFVVAEAECNWYLRDINIFPLLKKMHTSYI